MSEFVDKDNSACAVCCNCVFFVEESSQYLRRAFAEAWRVMKPGATMQFKWCTEQVPLREVAAMFPDKPITKTGTHKTYLIHFFKMP